MADDFRALDRDTPMLLPPSIQEWLPDQHMARFVVEIVEQLDLSEITSRYGGSGGRRAYHPVMMVALLFYGYATGVFSSRKLEQATYDSVAFRYITGDEHPDHDTIANFRKRFLGELEGLFKQVLEMAAELGTLRLGAGEPGWDEDAGEREQAQSDELGVLRTSWSSSWQERCRRC